MENCVETYKRFTGFSRWFMPKDLRFRGKHRILVHRAPEPAEIKYENLVYSKKSKRWRRIFTFFIAIIGITISCAFVVAAKIYQQSIPKAE